MEHSGHEIRFPHLGIVLKDVGEGFSIGGFEIKYYGILIALAFLLGLTVAYQAAKRSKTLNPELIFDYMLWMIIPAIIGARLYYVIFSWDYYGKHLNEIIQIRQGGLAIYGGIIAALIVLVIFCKKKEVSVWQMGDVAVKGLLVGQIIGRFGNFFNREAFGDFTNSFFAMQIPTEYFEAHGRISEVVASGVYDKAVFVEVGNTMETFIQVHPTFLYEAMCNLAILLVLIFFTKRKKFDGQLVAMYAIGYGIARFFIEGLRTDSLMILNTGVRVSQVVALLFALLGVIFIIYQLIRKKKQIS